MTDLNHLSPYVRYADDMTMWPNWHVRERVIFDFELMYIKEGEVEVTVEDQIYTGVPGDLFFFRPKQRHSIRSLGNTVVRQPHVHFDLIFEPDSRDAPINFRPLEALDPKEHSMFRVDVLEEQLARTSAKIRLPNPVEAERAIFAIIEEYRMKKPYHEIQLKGMMIQLLAYILREHYRSEEPRMHTNFERLARVREFLTVHADRSVTLDELASLVNMSKYHLITLFKKTYGMSPIQYHQAVRMEKSRLMLQFSDLPITEIAEQVGYPNIHSFSRAFKNAEGISPFEYRRQVRAHRKDH